MSYHNIISLFDESSEVQCKFEENHLFNQADLRLNFPKFFWFFDKLIKKNSLSQEEKQKWNTLYKHMKICKQEQFILPSISKKKEFAVLLLHLRA